MTAFKGLGTTGDSAGVVTPLDHKLSHAGQVLKTTTALGIRPGVFYSGNASLISGTAGMSYSVAAYNIVTQRSASAGAVFGGNDGTLSVATTAAPGSNSRIDIIYHWHREFSLDGVDSNPVIAVAQGTAAAVPTAPSLAAFPGAVEIGRATVAAGITATTSATITQTAPFTCMAGGVFHARTTTELASITNLLTDQEARCLADGVKYRWTGAAWVSTVVTSGLTPVVPTSAVNGTVAAGGKVTFSAQTTVSVNGCFTATYDNYRIVIETPTHAASQDTLMRLRVAGVDASGATTYGSQRLYGNASAATSGNLNSDKWTIDTASGVTSVKSKATVELTTPFSAVTTIGDSSFVNVASTSSIFTGNVGLFHTATTAYDGFTIYLAAGTMTGTIRIYGYNNN